MTKISELNAETQAMTYYGLFRMEDALVVDTLPDVVAGETLTPRFAYGHGEKLETLGDTFYNDWKGLLKARNKDFRTTRDELWQQGNAIIEIASDYSSTDIEAAINIDHTAGNIDGYFAGYKDDNLNVINKSGSNKTIEFPAYDKSKMPEKAASPKPVIDHKFPSGYKNPAHGNEPPMADQYSSKPIGYDFTHPYEAENNDALTQFMRDNSTDLYKAEEVASLVGSVRPMKDCLEEVWLTAPSLIDERANNVLRVASALKEVRTGYDSDRKNLEEVWWGSPTSGSATTTSKGAAGVYYSLAGVTSTYMHDVEEALRWINYQGRVVAQTYRKLRTAYGKAAVKHFQAVRDAVAEYTVAAVNSGDVGKGGDISGALESFVNAVKAAGDIHFQEMESSFDIQEALDDAKREYDGKNSTYQNSLSFEPSKDSGSYQDADDWKPKDGAPSEYGLDDGLKPNDFDPR